jgi:hypothetical protein
MKFLDKLLSALKNIKCKSKCCSGSECMCGTLEDNVNIQKQCLPIPSASTTPTSVG